MKQANQPSEMIYDQYHDQCHKLNLITQQLIKINQLKLDCCQLSPTKDQFKIKYIIIEHYSKFKPFQYCSMLKTSQPKVIQLVGIKQPQKQLYLTEEGKQFLQQINAPISVVTIAGLYRTGKSYLVNQLLGKLSTQTTGANGKFLVGDTVQSCTKGLNVWAVPFESTLSRPNFYYIIVDSEGIGSMEQQQNYDINLLMLIFLISSTVIYNSIGAIDQQSLDQLRVIINLKKSLGQQPNTQPRFVWVLRDFALQLINKRGEQMTSNEYLEDCLETVNSSNKQVIKKNEIRQAIKQSLPNRECHTLVRPTIKQADLSSLNSLPKTKLRKQFVQQVHLLYESIFKHSPSDIKYLNHETSLVDGPGMAKMIEYYLNQINCNKIPQVKSVWQLIQSTKFEQIMEECQSELKTQTLKIDLPISQEQLKQRLNQIQNKIFAEFQRKLASNDLKIYKKFNQQFLKITHKINTKLRKANQDIKKKKQLKKVRDTINRQIQFDKIDPTEIGSIRQVIQRLQLKNFADSQIYDYVLVSLLDVMDIAQQKSIKMKQVLEMYEQNKKQTELTNNTKQQQMIKLKHNYHEALKEISSMKTSHMDNVKDLAVTKQQLTLMENKLSLVSKEKHEKQDEFRKKIQQLNDKMRKKHQESAEALKSLRIENQSLTRQLEEAKQEINKKRDQERKQTLYEDKIKHSWDRFEQERTYFKKQLEKFKTLLTQSEQKTKELSEKQRSLESTLHRQRQIFAKKQRQFCEQLKWMKQNYSKTKQAYNQSYNTRMQHQQILKDITMGSKKKNLTIQNENILTPTSNTADKAILQQMTSTCESLKTQRITLQRQISNLETKLQKQKRQIQETREFYEKKIDRLQEQIKLNENSNQNEKQRFYSCLKELEEAKQAERQMYEQSIMRLLNNMESYQPLRNKAKTLEKGMLNVNSRTKKHLY